MHGVAKPDPAERCRQAIQYSKMNLQLDSFFILASTDLLNVVVLNTS